MRLLSILILLVSISTASLTEAATKTVTCTGEFGSGSGLAGSYVGDICRLKADSESERLVQKTCQQGSTCHVRAVVAVQPGGLLLIQRVLQVHQISMAPSAKRSYLEEVAGGLDGILAPTAGGCGNPQDTAEDRVSVLLDGLAGPAIQIHGRYCAVTSADGDKPGDGTWQAVLRASCGSVDPPDADLRAGRVGTKTQIVVQQRDGQIKIDGEPLVRCPIRKAYTPLWWIKSSYTFRGRYPGE